jgi:hypothetical protein
LQALERQEKYTSRTTGICRDLAHGNDNNDKKDYNEVQYVEEKISLQNCHKRLLGA